MPSNPTATQSPRTPAFIVVNKKNILDQKLLLMGVCIVVQFYYLTLLLNFFPSASRCFFKHKYQLQEEAKAGHCHLNINYGNSSSNPSSDLVYAEEDEAAAKEKR